MHFTGHEIINYAWVVTGVICLIGSLVSKPTVRSQSLSSRLIQAACMILSFLLLFDRYSDIGPLGWRVIPDSIVSLYIGTVLTLAGIAFAVWSRFFLGGNWSAAATLKQNHELIRSGPYAIVRHPIYSGFLLAMLGTAITLGELRGLIAVVLATVGRRLKSLTEESLMTEQFGAQYIQYKDDVKALIPSLW